MKAQLFSFVCAAILALGFSSQAKAICGGCAEVEILEKKFSALKRVDDDAAVPLLIKASAAVKRMPTQKHKKLSQEQIHAISKLLAAAFLNDPDYAIIDNNFALFKANANEFFADFKTFSKQDAENLESELSIKLGEAQEGQDEPPAKSKK